MIVSAKCGVTLYGICRAIWRLNYPFSVETSLTSGTSASFFFSAGSRRHQHGHNYKFTHRIAVEYSCAKIATP